VTENTRCSCTRNRLTVIIVYGYQVLRLWLTVTLLSSPLSRLAGTATILVPNLEAAQCSRLFHLPLSGSFQSVFFKSEISRVRQKFWRNQKQPVIVSKSSPTNKAIRRGILPVPLAIHHLTNYLNYIGHITESKATVPS
jgi:hypothetical protein